jgi:hypothetical protein
MKWALDELKVWPATMSRVCAALSDLSAALWVTAGGESMGKIGAAAEAAEEAEGTEGAVVAGGAEEEFEPDFGSDCFELEVPIAIRTWHEWQGTD